MRLVAGFRRIPAFLRQTTSADRITLSRLPLEVLVWVAMAFQQWLPALAVTVLIGVTDWLDGRRARYLKCEYGIETWYGGLLDAGADKLRIIFWMIVGTWFAPTPLLTFLLYIYIGFQMFLIRDGVLAAVASNYFPELDLSSNWGGKIKFTLEWIAAFAVLVLFWQPHLEWLSPVVHALIVVAIGGAIASIDGHRREARSTLEEYKEK